MKSSKSETSLVEMDIHVSNDGRDEDDEGEVVHKATWAQEWQSLKNSCSVALFPVTSGEICTKRFMSSFLKRAKSNLRSGATVALVNLCLSISLAISSNASPSSGCVTGIFAGLVHSIFAGSDFNIVGPTGALSGILSSYALKYNEGFLGYMAVFTGVICFIFFAFRWERYILLVPSSVTEGFTLGVAIILALGQLNFLMGLPKLTKHEAFVENVIEQFKNIDLAKWYVALMWFVCISSLMYLSTRFPKIPWVIPLNILGLLLGYLVTEYEWFELETLGSRYGEVTLEVKIPEVDDVSQIFSGDMISGSVSVAFVAILETLISAKIADGMTKTVFAQRKEVFALSACNVAGGILGGFPATAALARTALNIKSGASSYLSELINGIILLLLCVLLLPTFKYLPLFIIAASIWYSALRMVALKSFKRFWRLNKGVFGLGIAVAALCVYFEPTVGLAVGMIVGLLIFADSMSQGHSEVILTQNGQSRSVTAKEVVYNVKIAKLKKRFPFLDPNGSEFQRIAQMYASAEPVSPRSGDVEMGDMRRTLSAVSLDSPTAIGSPQPADSAAGPSGAVPAQGVAPTLKTLPPANGELPLTETHGNVLVYRMAGQLTFINSCSHMERIKHFAENKNVNTVILSLRYLFYIDLDGLEALDECIDMLTEHEKKVLISGVNVGIKTMVMGTKWYKELHKEHRIFKTYLDALVNEEGAEPELQERRLVPNRSSPALTSLVPQDATR